MIKLGTIKLFVKDVMLLEGYYGILMWSSNTVINERYGFYQNYDCSEKSIVEKFYINNRKFQL